MSSSGTSAASGGDSKYFQTTKKGEIKELQDDLNSLDKVKVKEAVKKVIAAMTVGKDVSTLFSDVIKSMATDNIELKKLVYLYIINYARSQPEKAILVVNMFQRDATSHPNPLVRALAIRTMGCIRVDRITEYLCDPLMVALKDKDPYVRKTAAICVAKLYDIQADLVMDRGFVEQLRAMLSDTIPMVVANAVAALTEISVASGTDQFKIDGSTISKLLTAINDCGDWSRVFILEAVSRFDVTNPALARDVCDRVVPQLQHANSAVVMAAVKVIIHCLPKLKKDAQTLMYSKLTPPLVTLVSSTQPEIQYVALRNIDLIVQRYPRILEKEIRAFFVKFNDQVYVKMEKLEILIKLASKRTFEQVLSEFHEYASEIDIEFVRKSVRAIGRVAIKLSEAAEKCVKVLSTLVKTKVNYVVQEAVIVIRDIFRKYPRKYEKIIVTLCQNLEALDEPEAKASMIWIIGEYAERITDAGERLEYFIDSFEEESPTVQLQLVTATVKLFLKKPESAKTLVTRVLELATEKSDNPDLRDRGYVYWRLLSTDPKAAKEVVLAPRPVISSETYSPSEDYLDTLLENISTLSAVYHRAPTEFVRGMRGGVKLTLREEEEEDDDSSSDDSSDDDSSDDDSSDDSSEEKTEDASPKKKGGGRKKGGASSSKKPTSAATVTSSVPVVSVSTPADSAATSGAGGGGGGDGGLLYDLFGGAGGGGGGGGASGAAAAASTTAGGGSGGSDGGFMDDFDPFGDSGPSASSGPALPPMTRVMDASTHKGLNVEFGFVRRTGVATLIARVQNVGGGAVVRMDVKFNKNYLGITPKATLPLSGTLGVGSTQVLETPMAVSGPEFMKTPFDNLVMVGIRVGYSDGNQDVFKFSANVPGSIFFEEGANLEQTAYLGEWKAIAPETGKQAMLKAIKVTDQQAVQQLLAGVNGKFIAPRKIPGKGVALYFLFLIKSVNILSEVSIANSGACRIVSKSRNPNYAEIVTFALQSLLAA